MATVNVCWGFSLSHVPRVRLSWSSHTMVEGLPLLFCPTVIWDLVIPILELKEVTTRRHPWFA